MRNDIKDIKTDVSGLKSEMNEMNTKFNNIDEALKKIMKKLQIEWNKSNNYIFSLLLILNN